MLVVWLLLVSTSLAELPAPRTECPDDTVPFSTFYHVFAKVLKESALQRSMELMSKKNLDEYLELYQTIEIPISANRFRPLKTCDSSKKCMSEIEPVAATEDEIYREFFGGERPTCVTRNHLQNIFRKDPRNLKPNLEYIDMFVKATKMLCICPTLTPEESELFNMKCEPDVRVTDAPRITFHCREEDVFGDRGIYTTHCREHRWLYTYMVPDKRFCSGLMCDATGVRDDRQLMELFNKLVLPLGEKRDLEDRLKKHFERTIFNSFSLTDHSSQFAASPIMSEYRNLFGGPKKVSVGQMTWSDKKQFQKDGTQSNAREVQIYLQDVPIVRVDSYSFIRPLTLPDPARPDIHGVEAADKYRNLITTDTFSFKTAPHCPTEIRILTPDEVEDHKSHSQYRNVVTKKGMVLHLLLPFCLVECSISGDETKHAWMSDLFPKSEIESTKQKYFAMSRKVLCSYDEKLQKFIYKTPFHPRCESPECWGKGSYVHHPFDWEYEAIVTPEINVDALPTAFPPSDTLAEKYVMRSEDAAKLSYELYQPEFDNARDKSPVCAKFKDSVCPGPPAEYFTFKNSPVRIWKPIHRVQLLGVATIEESKSNPGEFLDKGTGAPVLLNRIHDLQDRLFDKLPTNVPWSVPDAEIVLIPKYFKKCPNPPNPPPAPINFSKIIPLITQLPTTFPQPQVNVSIELRVSQYRRNELLRSLFLKPWPSTTESWPQDRQVAPAAFPALQINCDILNKEAGISGNGKVKFEYNVDFNPSKDPWEEGGLCRKSASKAVSGSQQTQTNTTGEFSKRNVTGTISQESSPVKRQLPRLAIRVKAKSQCSVSVVAGTFFDGTGPYGIAGGALQLRVGPPVKYTGAMTAETALRHVFMSTLQSDWNDVFDGGFLCSDVQTPLKGAAVPGGDLGEFIALAAAVDVSVSVKEVIRWAISSAGSNSTSPFGSTATDAPLSKDDVFQMLVHWLIYGGTRKFHWCMDVKMMDGICKKTSWCPRDFRALLQPPPQLLATLQQLVEQPTYIGSRFLRSMILYPEKYSIRADLVKYALNSIYSIFWRTGAALSLPGDTLEYLRSKLVPTLALRPPSAASGIIRVSSGSCPGSFTPALAGLASTGSQAMMVYEDAAHAHRMRAAAYVSSLRGLDVDATILAEFHKRIGDIADSSWQQTIDLYSYKLPSFCVAYGPPQSASCDFNPSFSPVTPQSDHFIGANECIVIRSPRDEKLKPAVKLSHMSAAASEIHSLITSQSVKWGPAMSGASGNVDGRHTEAVQGILGGDLGQWVISLAAVERLRKIPFTESDIQSLFIKYLRFTGQRIVSAYLDVSSLMYLCQAGHFCPTVNINDDLDSNQRITLAIRKLSTLSPAVAQKLLPIVSDAEGTGDMFLRFLLMSDPPTAVRPDLVRHALRAFFRTLWKLAPTSNSKDEYSLRLDLVALPGSRGEERAVVQLTHGRSVPDTHAPLIRPSWNGISINLHNVHASRTHRLNFLKMLFTELRMKPEDFVQLRLSADGIDDQCSRALWGSTAQQLPIYLVHFQ